MSNHTDILNSALMARGMMPATFACPCCGEAGLDHDDMADLDHSGFYAAEIKDRFGPMICKPCADEMSLCDKCGKATPDYERQSHIPGWDCLCTDCATKEADADYLRHQHAAEVSA